MMTRAIAGTSTRRARLRSDTDAARSADIPRRHEPNWCTGIVRELQHRQPPDSATPATACEGSLRVLLGPQWDRVLAIISTLENDKARECEASLPLDLRADRWTSMRWITATEVVLRAAIEHGRARQIDPARRIARHVGATGTHGLAATDAVRALTMQDLVGLHGFTTAHYEYLLQPWGYLHPDWSPIAVEGRRQPELQQHGDHCGGAIVGVAHHGRLR